MTGRSPTPLGLSLRSGLLGVAAAGPLAAAVGGITGGLRGLVSALLGALLVALFFLVSLWTVERANAIDPAMTLPVGMTVYGTLIVVLGGVLLGTPLPNRLDTLAFAWSVVAVTLAWLTAQASAVWRTRIPYVVIAPEQPAEPREGSATSTDSR